MNREGPRAKKSPGRHLLFPPTLQVRHRWEHPLHGCWPPAWQPLSTFQSVLWNQVQIETILRKHPEAWAFAPSLTNWLWTWASHFPFLMLLFCLQNSMPEAPSCSKPIKINWPAQQGCAWALIALVCTALFLSSFACLCAGLKNLHRVASSVF